MCDAECGWAYRLKVPEATKSLGAVYLVLVVSPANHTHPDTASGRFTDEEGWKEKQCHIDAYAFMSWDGSD